jgi:hypothetical protein
MHKIEEVRFMEVNKHFRSPWAPGEERLLYTVALPTKRFNCPQW